MIFAGTLLCRFTRCGRSTHRSLERLGLIGISASTTSTARERSALLGDHFRRTSRGCSGEHGRGDWEPGTNHDTGPRPLIFIAAFRQCESSYLRVAK